MIIVKKIVEKAIGIKNDFKKSLINTEENIISSK